MLNTNPQAQKTDPPPTGATPTTKPLPPGQKTMEKPARAGGKPLTPEERKTIVDGYAAGMSIRALQLTFGFAKPTIRKAILAGGGQLRGDANTPKFSNAQLRAWHRYGWTARRIADNTGADIRTVLKRMAKVGISPVAVPERLPVAEIMDAYVAGSSLKALAALHSVHVSTIRRLIVNNGGVIRTNIRRPRLNPLLLADYCRRGHTVQQISDATGATRETVRVHLKANGLQVANNVPGRERPAIYRISPQGIDGSEAAE